VHELRILSLLPAATEIIYLLGLEKYLVGVSHECDYPLEARLLPQVTSSPISNELSSQEINKAVAKLKHKGSGVFHIDEKLLRKLNPTLILTQELCDVCAISWTQVKQAAKILDGDVKIISLEPESISDIFENILLIGETSRKSLESRKVVEGLQERLESIQSRLRHLARNHPNRVLIIEWLDPIMIAGHWVPEIVEKAGGTGVITKPGQKSFPITIDQVIASDPSVIIFAPCGFDIKRILREKSLIEEVVKISRSYKKYNPAKYFLMDGNAYLTRPGPRIIDGVEILVEILHPEIFSKKHTKSDWQSLEF
jgi:iron complex transport system substrate-binding protein